MGLTFCPQDAFYYTFIFDPNQKTLTSDRGEIRVGSKYQADITPLISHMPAPGVDREVCAAIMAKYERRLEDLETLVWSSGSFDQSQSKSSLSPSHSPSPSSTSLPDPPASSLASAAAPGAAVTGSLESSQVTQQPAGTGCANGNSSNGGTGVGAGAGPGAGGGPQADRSLEHYLTLVRSIATWARVVDTASTVKHAGIHMCAAAACRDTTLVLFSHPLIAPQPPLPLSLLPPPPILFSSTLSSPSFSHPFS